MFLPTSEVDAALDSRYSGRGASLWLGVSTTEPTLAADGSAYSNFTEPTATSYGRVEVTAVSWPAFSARAAEVTVAWPDPSEDLGVAVAWGLFEASTGGSPVSAGIPKDSVTLSVGTTGVEITCRIESPTDLYASF